ncbi:hypothetical protein ACH5RR_028942 [Cinchona calisaya]|uniref:Uncharacterized protein n=1 Tax=Cinchona calisaya TaxID=153742 RepID=A0ABD2YQ83_9GENT
MVRTPSIDKNGLKKGAWSKEEDEKLRTYIQKYGHWNWRQLPKFAGLSRCGKSCRLRWMNYLRPGVRRGNYTIEEENLIIKLHKEFGNRWSAIAGKLPGRTDNEIKNHWHAHLRKKQVPKPPKVNDQTEQYNGRSQHVDDADQNQQASSISKFGSIIEKNSGKSQPDIANTNADAFSEVSSLSCDSRLFDAVEWITDYSISSEELFAESFGSFWTEPFILDISHMNNIQWLPPVEDEFMYPFCFLDDGFDSFHELNQ